MMPRYADKETDPFYKSGPWRKVRAARLELDNYLCTDCVEQFLHHGGTKPRAATMVHHEIARDVRPDLALDIENLRSLCDACHNKRHPEKGRKDDAGRQRPIGIRVIKI